MSSTTMNLLHRWVWQTVPSLCHKEWGRLSLQWRGWPSSLLQPQRSKFNTAENFNILNHVQNSVSKDKFLLIKLRNKNSSHFLLNILAPVPKNQSKLRLTKNNTTTNSRKLSNMLCLQIRNSSLREADFAAKKPNPTKSTTTYHKQEFWQHTNNTIHQRRDILTGTFTLSPKTRNKHLGYLMVRLQVIRHTNDITTDDMVQEQT